MLAVLARAQRQYLFPWGTVSFEGLDLCTPAGPIPLTLHESRMLKVLLRSRGEPVPRDALSYAAGGTPGPAGSRAVDVHVASLRRKMRAAIPAAGRFILCVAARATSCHSVPEIRGAQIHGVPWRPNPRSTGVPVRPEGRTVACKSAEYRDALFMPGFP